MLAGFSAFSATVLGLSFIFGNSIRNLCAPPPPYNPLSLALPAGMPRVCLRARLAGAAACSSVSA